MGFVSDIVGSITGANDAADAAGDAARTQAQSAQAGIDEQRRQFDALQALLQPYVQAGTGALGGYQALAGLSGRGAQRSAISGLESSPEFQALIGQGEEAILQNASATGGLRSGNTQGALAQFRPQMLSQLIEQQYGRLGNLASLGQSSAAGVGNAGISTGNSIADLLQQQGAATAGGQIAQGSAGRTGFGDLLRIGSVASGFF